MRILFAAACLLMATSTTWAVDSPSVIPRPWSVKAGGGGPVALTANTVVRPDGDDAKPVAAWLRTTLALISGITVGEVAGTGKGSITSGDIVLRLDPDLVDDGPDWAQEEGYHLSIGAGTVVLTARTAHGLFNGATTLVQMATQIGSNGKGWGFPAMTIDDHPRFRWRGMMLDTGRHFATVDEVERFIDLIALHKFNRFHWHLTEDQGWRIEVKRRPKLTSIGAWRAESPTMGDTGRGDGQPYGGFYTQDDIRAVVAYAAARFVTVVPEIEMPGHSTAAIASYPELGNQDIPGWQAPLVATHWGVINHTLSPRESTFDFIDQVFEEILPLFPGEYVHIGGDEAPTDEWQQSPFAQEVIRTNHLDGESALQSWFIHRVEGMLKARGKRLIGWDEIQDGGLSPTATMMVWRGWRWNLHGLDQGNSVVMAPTSHTYFDNCQGAIPDGPGFQIAGGDLSLDTVFGFQPVPAEATAQQAGQILGAQGQIWTEYIWSRAKVEYMAWPRACALAEVVWSSPGGDGADFHQRLASHLELLDRMHVNYRRDDGSPAQPDQPMVRTPHPPLP